MKNQNQSSAFHFFLYAVMFLSLGFVVFGAGGILFQFVNKYLPDAVAYSIGSFDQGGVRFGIAALLIAGPLYFFLARLVNESLHKGDIKKDSKIRRWLTYIILFFAAATIIGDLVTLITNFLSGDIVASFLLKVLIVLLLAGSVFGYYFWDMRSKEIDKKKARINKLVAWCGMGFVVVVFVGAFFIIDSPSLAREKRIDQQTVSDVQSIDTSIRSFFNQSGKLPESLNDLEKTGFSPYLQSSSKIGYEVMGKDTYKLCASFVRSDADDKDIFYGVGSSTEWKHGEGEICFERIALGDGVPTQMIK